MKITNAAFYKSIFKISEMPKPSLPEVVFCGRSNVGKSSLINKLLNRKCIARTSSTPGRTQSVNFIIVNNSFYFVDLPGYGYAKVPDEIKKGWKNLVEGYLIGRDSVKSAVLLIDSRRDPNVDEKELCEWFKANSVFCIVVLTKIDKLKMSHRRKAVQQWERFLDIDGIVVFSSVTGEGRNEIWRKLDLK